MGNFPGLYGGFGDLYIFLWFVWKEFPVHFFFCVFFVFLHAEER